MYNEILARAGLDADYIYKTFKSNRSAAAKYIAEKTGLGFDEASKLTDEIYRSAQLPDTHYASGEQRESGSLAHVKCNNCGASFMPQQRGASVCPYCGATYTPKQREVVVNSDIDNFLKKASDALRGGRFREAEDNCCAAIGIDNNCGEAYLMRLQARLSAAAVSSLCTKIANNSTTAYRKDTDCANALRCLNDKRTDSLRTALDMNDAAIAARLAQKEDEQSDLVWKVLYNYFTGGLLRGPRRLMYKIKQGAGCFVMGMAAAVIAAGLVYVFKVLL